MYIRNYKKILIILLVCILCTGCKAKYTLTYNNKNFEEEIIFSDINLEEEKYFSRIYRQSPDLKFDDDNYYEYYNYDNKIRLYYNIGNKLTKTKLLEYCFENVYVIDKDEYIDIETDGENYCNNYNIEISFKTDKYVYDNNANKVDNGIYTWSNTNDGIKILVSKNNNWKKEEKNGSMGKIIIMLLIIFIFITTLVFLRKNKKNIKNNDFDI